MIGKVTRGKDIGGLLRYLYGPGKTNEHTNPHLVASWRGDDRPTLDQLEPAPGRSRQRFAALADRLSLPLHLLPDIPDKHVWQCSMRLADSDRRLTDAEWASVAREVVETTGFAPANDPGGCRWVAVRHADDHIHIAVVLARQDGQPVNTYRDWPKVHAAARAVEQKFGLTTVPSPDRSASVAPSRGEVEKAGRKDAREPVRTWLAREVRTAAAGSTSREEFERILLLRRDVVIGWRESQRSPGEMTGYKVGRVGDADAQGKQVWFSGSKLSPDLSLPKLTARWQEVGSPTGRPRPSASALTKAERREILDRSADALLRAYSGPARPWAIISAGEVATSLARITEGENGGPLTEAAEDLSRASRQPRGTRPVASVRVHDLRSVATDLFLLGKIAPGEAGHVLLIAADLARIAASISRSARSAQGLAARRAAEHYARYAGPVQEAQVRHVRSALSEDLAANVLADPAWPALAAQMRQLETQGVDPSRALSVALQSREIISAQSVAQVLHHRLLNGAAAPPARPTPRTAVVASPRHSRAPKRGAG